jgi:hypothetical protein
VGSPVQEGRERKREEGNLVHIFLLVEICGLKQIRWFYSIPEAGIFKFGNVFLQGE